jgi:hypothetical protein
MVRVESPTCDGIREMLALSAGTMNSIAACALFHGAIGLPRTQPNLVARLERRFDP